MPIALARNTMPEGGGSRSGSGCYRSLTHHCYRPRLSPLVTLLLSLSPPPVDARRGYSIGVPDLDRGRIELRTSELDTSRYHWDPCFKEDRAHPAGYMKSTGIRKLLLAELARKQGSIKNNRPAARKKFLDNGISMIDGGWKFPSQKFIDSIGMDDYGPW